VKSDHPGPISNQTLLKRFDKYFREDNEADPTNFVIRSKVREGYDYKLLPEEVWSPLFKKFGGLEIKRYKDTEYYSRKYILRFPMVLNISHSHVDLHFGFATL
jgi:DUSP domain